MALYGNDLIVTGSFTGTVGIEWRVDYTVQSSSSSKFTWKTRNIGDTDWGNTSSLYPVTQYINNTISGTSITQIGSDYDSNSPPNVVVSNSPDGTTATITASITNAGELSGLTITNAGSGYTEIPTITIDAPPIPEGTRALATVNALDTDNELSVGSGLSISLKRNISGQYWGVVTSTFWWTFSANTVYEKVFSRIHPFLNTDSFNLLGYNSDGDVDYLEDIYSLSQSEGFNPDPVGSLPASTKITISTRGNDNFVGCGKDFPPQYIGFPNVKQFGSSNEDLIMVNGELRLITSSMEGLEQVVIANGDGTADDDTYYVGYQKENPLLILFDKAGLITTFNVGGAITAMSVCTTDSSKIWVAYRGSAYGSVARLSITSTSIAFDTHGGKDNFFAVTGHSSSEIPQAQEQDNYISDILYVENDNATEATREASGRLFLQRYVETDSFYFQPSWGGHKYCLYRFDPFEDYANNPKGDGDDIYAVVMNPPGYGHLNSPTEFDGTLGDTKDGAFYHIHVSEKHARKISALSGETDVEYCLFEDGVVSHNHAEGPCEHADDTPHQWTWYEYNDTNYTLKAFSHSDGGKGRYRIKLAKRGLMLYAKSTTQYSVGLVVNDFRLIGEAMAGLEGLDVEYYDVDDGIISKNDAKNLYPHGNNVAGGNFPDSCNPNVYAQETGLPANKYKKAIAGPFLKLGGKLRLIREHIVTFNDAESYSGASFTADGSMNTYIALHEENIWTGFLYGSGASAIGLTADKHIRASDRVQIEDAVVGDIIGNHPMAFAMIKSNSSANIISPSASVPTGNASSSLDYTKQITSFPRLKLDKLTTPLSFSDVQAGNLGLSPRVIPGTGTRPQDMGQVSVFRKSGQFNMDNIDWGKAGTTHPGGITTETVANPTSISVTVAALTAGSEPIDKNNIMPGEDTTTADNSYHKNFYKFSLLFDGYLETALSQDIATHTGNNPSKKGHQITININKENLNQRISHIQVYRGISVHDGGVGLTKITEPDFDYRLVKSISLNDIDWSITTIDGTSYFQYILKDNQGKNFGSYESNTGISPEMRITHLRYGLAAPVTGYLFVGDAKNGYTGKVPNHIFRSKPGKYPIFNWATEYTVLPEKPNCLIGFTDKLFAFTPSRGFIINPETLTIMDELHGSGCLSDHSFVVTDFGLFYADRNGLYRHDGRRSQPIGQVILDSDHADLKPYAWQKIDWDTNDLIMGFDSQRNAVLYIFTDMLAPTQSVAWVYTIRSNRWDLWKFGKKITSICQGQYGEIIANASTLMTIATDKETNESWEYQTKKLTANLDTEDKHFMAVYSVGDNTPTTKYKTEKYDSSWLSLSASGRVSSAYKKAKWLEIQLSGSGTDTIDSVGYHYRPLKVKQEKA